jgi:hypothetical protein
VGRGRNFPANATTERNSGGTTTTMTRRMTVYFQLVEIDGNRCGNVNGWLRVPFRESFLYPSAQREFCHIKMARTYFSIRN